MPSPPGKGSYQGCVLAQDHRQMRQAGGAEVTFERGVKLESSRSRSSHRGLGTLRGSDTKGSGEEDRHGASVAAEDEVAGRGDLRRARLDDLSTIR